MRTSISVATSMCGMPQIMFNGNFEQHVHALAELGYEGVDLFIPDPLHADIDAIAKTLQKANLAVTMLAAQGDLMADGYFLNTPSSEKRVQLLERSKRHLDMAAKLQAAPNIGFIRGKLPQKPEEQQESLQHMAEGMQSYCQLAASFGLFVLLEPICRYEINSCNTVAQSLKLMELAEQPKNLSLLLDIFHMNIEEASLLDAIASAQGQIGHVHFVDNTRAVPGYGCLPLADVYTSLSKAGYDGFLGIEAIPGQNPLQEAQDALLFVQQLSR